MWEDPDAGRTTEIDFIQGEIVRLASKTKRAAPLNERIIELIKNTEQAMQGSPKIEPEAVRALS
jgi:2-dehydropantoate 2-reductase